MNLNTLNLNALKLTASVVTLVLAGSSSAAALQDENHSRRRALEHELRAVHVQIEQHQREDREVPKHLVEMEAQLARELHAVEASHEARVEEVFAWLLTFNEEESIELLQLRELNPREFHERMQHLLPWFEHMQELRREDEEQYELERESHLFEVKSDRLAREYHEASPDERTHLKEEMRGTLKRLFEVRLSLRRLQIERLETELSELRQQVERMSKSPDEMIARRLEMMLREGEEW
ncbi:MAG: hypothetical protein ACYTHJ_08785 [Planctomycetota bacterium]|jgi:hypothetical protein